MKFELTKAWNDWARKSKQAELISTHNNIQSAEIDLIGYVFENEPDKNVEARHKIGEQELWLNGSMEYVAGANPEDTWTVGDTNRAAIGDYDLVIRRVE